MNTKTFNPLRPRALRWSAVVGAVTLASLIGGEIRADSSTPVESVDTAQLSTFTAVVEGDTGSQGSGSAVTEHTSNLIYSGESGGMNDQCIEGFGGVIDWISDGRILVPSASNIALSILILDGTEFPFVYEVAVNIDSDVVFGLLTIDEKTLLADEGSCFYATITLHTDENADRTTRETISSGYIRVKKLNTGG